VTPGAQAVYDELNGRKGIFDGFLDDREIIEEICEAVAATVLSALIAGLPAPSGPMANLWDLRAYAPGLTEPLTGALRIMHPLDEKYPSQSPCPAHGEDLFCCLDALLNQLPERDEDS
jgi:hypothetical protein